MNVKKLEKALNYELRRCEVEAMDKIPKDLEDAARRHNSKIFYWHVNKFRGSSQSRLVIVKYSNGAVISDKRRFKERNRDRVTGKDTEENEKVCDTWDVKEDLFCDEELATALK